MFDVYWTFMQMLICFWYVKFICLIIYLTTCVMFCMINTIICIDIYYTIDCTKYITENKHHDMTVGLVQWLWLFRKENSDKDTPVIPRLQRTNHLNYVVSQQTVWIVSWQQTFTKIVFTFWIRMECFYATLATVIFRFSMVTIVTICLCTSISEVYVVFWKSNFQYCKDTERCGNSVEVHVYRMPVFTFRIIL